MIHLTDVTFSYTPQTEPAVKNLSISFEASSHTAILGPDGSGKTTLAKLIKGSLEPDSGTVTSELDQLLEIGYVGGDPSDFLVGVTVEDEVVFGLENIGTPSSKIRSRLEQALTWTGLSGMENRLTHSLSGGEQQRLALAGWLAMGCRAFILDDALSMLDRRTRSAIQLVIKKLRDKIGVTIIEVTNNIEQTLTADRMVFIRDGSVLFNGSPLDFLHQEIGFQWARFAGGLAGLAAELSRRGLLNNALAEIEDLDEGSLQTLFMRLFP
jgi:energy-coupling factor transport system ATP-binding protein